MKLITFNKILLNIKMDELSQYLKTGYYNEIELQQILDKKIMITKNHVENINLDYFNIHWYFDIITLFKKYGYIFTNDDYILLVNKNKYIIKIIPDDMKTDKLCKITVKSYGYLLQLVPEDKKTYDLCKIAVRQDGQALLFVPKNKKTEEICKIAMRQDKYASNYVPDDIYKKLKWIISDKM